MIPDLPNIDPEYLDSIDKPPYALPGYPGHPPRILILHGSVRRRSYSRAVGDEAERLLTWFGAEVRRFDPSGLPLPDDADAAQPRVQGLRDLAIWLEGVLWSSTERHGAMPAIMKAQID